MHVRLSEMRPGRPRQRGTCWAICQLWEQLQLDEFWGERLRDSREGTCWHHVLMPLTAHRLIDPGSEWWLHREWYERSAMADLPEEDGALAAKGTLYRGLGKLLVHKEALPGILKQCWRDLFGVRFEVLLYDLTSTCFGSDPHFDEGDERHFGNSRDHRPDCAQATSKQQLKAHAPGLTVRQALEKLAAMQLLDVHFPTTDDRELIFMRYTGPETDQQLLLAKLGWTLPPQSARNITAAKIAAAM